MKKNSLNISASKFAMAHAKLKKFEKDNGPIKIGNNSLLHFLMSHINLAENIGESIIVKTKRIILNIAGDFSTDPDTLEGSIKLKANLGYGADEYSLLKIRLDKLVKESVLTASVSNTEATACEKVSDCTKLITTKTTIPV